MNAPVFPFTGMTIDALLAVLDERVISLRLCNEQLAVQAPKDALTDELRAALAEHKNHLVDILKRRGSGNDALPTLAADPQSLYEPFALTDVQHAYWMGRNAFLELGGVSTHFYFELDSRFALPRLQAALRQVIARHDMLRAVIQPDGRQRVLAEVPPYVIEATDVCGLPPAEREAALARTRDAMSHQVLPAERWPLFEVRATQLDDETVRLHLSLDLLVIDGASMFILLRDWHRFCEHPRWSPAPLPLAYRDYVLAEQSLRGGAAWQRARRYWLDRVGTLPPRPELPVLARKDDLPPRFTRRRARLAREAWSVLKRRARQEGATPSVLLMAAFAEVLRRWAKAPDFTLNLTLFNRLPLHPRVGELLGDFTSLTLLAVHGSVHEPFAARVRRLQRQLSQDLEHAQFGGVEVLRELSRRSGGAAAAAMPVVFTSALVYEEAPDELSEPVGAFVQGVSQTPQVWLDHQVFEERGELVFNWDAVEAAFPARLLDDMFASWQELLERLARDAGAWSCEAGLAALPHWQRQEREAANDTRTELRPRTLNGMVETQARRTPDALAVIANDGQLTYRELAEQAFRLARRLRELGAQPETLVAVAMERGWEPVAAVLGIQHAGAAYLPLDPTLPAQRRALLLAQGGVSIVMTQARLKAALALPPNIEAVCFDDQQTRRCMPAPLEEPEEPARLAYVIFTSGSTGTPKGVAVEHWAAANTVKDINRRFGVRPGDRVLALSSLGFDLSVYDLLGVLAAGGTVVMPSPRRAADPVHWAALVARHGVTVWNSVPQLFQMWVESVQAAPPSQCTLRLAMLSGDWIPVRLPDAARALAPGLQVVSLGGATEAAIWSVAYPIGRVDPAWPSIPYGKPLANQTLHVLNELFEPCAVWATGQIHIGGDGLARGYWGDEAKTAERFVKHPRTGQRLYRTGDLGRYLPGGDIEFLGREDHQVKVNGYRIELGEITAHLRRLPGVAEALVKVAPGPDGRSRQLVAYLVPQGSATLDLPAMRAALAAALPEYMVPLQIVAIEALPLTATGKVDHKALPAPWAGAPRTPGTMPRDALERHLHGLWSEALAQAGFGVDDNFFDLGGDSLVAMRIVTRVQQAYVLQPQAIEGLLRHFFENPTVTALAAFVREGRARNLHELE